MKTIFHEQPIQPIRLSELDVHKDTPITAPKRIDLPETDKKPEIKTKRILEIKNV